MKKHALIVGAGSGISAAFARALAADGYQVGLAARNTEKLEDLANEIKAKTFLCDVTEPDSVTELFAEAAEAFGTLDVVLFNASGRERGPVADLDPDRVKAAIMVSAYGGFLVAQQATKRMLEQGHGALFFTGASASVKGYPQSSSFAMGKFALRGLAQSLARELQPKNIHVAHFVIDGGVANVDRGLTNTDDDPDKWLEPDAIAQTYMAILNQPRSAWSWEVELRPWVEKF